MIYDAIKEILARLLLSRNNRMEMTSESGYRVFWREHRSRAGVAGRGSRESPVTGSRMCRHQPSRVGTLNAARLFPLEPFGPDIWPGPLGLFSAVKRMRPTIAANA